MRGARQLKAQVERLAGAGAVLIAERVTDWSSLTFAGARHQFTFRFEGGQADQGTAFLETVPGHSFALIGASVTEAKVRKFYRVRDVLTVMVELLTVND